MSQTANNIQLDTIADAINDIRNGKIIIVVDDENRENEGDFLAAAEMVTRNDQFHGDQRKRIDLYTSN